jgi:hypothetical protein
MDDISKILNPETEVIYMKLAVIGSRSFNDYNMLKEKLDKLNSRKKIRMIVSGGAAGADCLAEQWAGENDVEVKVFFPDWEKYGKPAGFIRNKQIIDSADAVIAFWDGQSRGTQHSINLAKARGIPVHVIKFL